MRHKAQQVTLAAAITLAVLPDRTVPVDAAQAVPPRAIVTTSVARPPARPDPVSPDGSWPTFRGPQASGAADGQNLPDSWDGATRRNVLWRAKVPGLAHSSPIVWGHRAFITSAISSDPKASFRPGLYG